VDGVKTIKVTLSVDSIYFKDWKYIFSLLLKMLYKLLWILMECTWVNYRCIALNYLIHSIFLKAILHSCTALLIC